ncbi:hypothetical protein K7432_005126 [Basidiobolus ranarum]|uniref:Uncharacterized protein n=1 Tax=Basidiobolus ranarum TaxID=34480 RepID=A0ABR2W3J3_9FUNG
MIASYNTSDMLVKSDSMSTSTYPTVSLVQARKKDDLSHEYIPISNTEVISKAYVLDNLRKMGSILFNNPDSTNTCLHLNDERGNTMELWVHDFYFLHESSLLYQLLHQFSKPNTPETENSNPYELSITSLEDKENHHVYVTVPSVNGIEHLLRWVYTREDNEWLMSMNEENFESIMENVAFLRLNQEAYYVMALFYENL